MSEFLQQVVNGLTLGSVYAIVALGFTLIFGVLQLIAFAPVSYTHLTLPTSDLV